MSWLSSVQILLFLSIGAFLLPAMAGGRARAIAGMVISGIAVCGLIVLGILQTIFGPRYVVQASKTQQSAVYRQAVRPAKAKAKGSAESILLAKQPIDNLDAGPVGAGLDPVQFERERAEIEQLWHDAELERRLWHVGSLAGGLFAWLAVVAAYLKFDLRSSGHYRGRLRIATTGALALATAAAAWAWTQPLS